MFTKGPQEAWAEPPSVLIGSAGLPASVRACNWPRERRGMGEKTCTEMEMKRQLCQDFHRRFHMRKGGTNVRINMRPHVGVEALFGPLLYTD